MTVEFIIPVGTSLLTGWLRQTAPHLEFPAGWLPVDSLGADGAKPPNHREWQPQLAAALKNGDRTSAELDSIGRWMGENPEQSVERITLLVSETDECRWIAELLESSFENHLGIGTVESVHVPQLSIEKMREGLVEFVREAARAVKDAQSRGARPVVNATPGFKAEASLLTLLGAVLGAETIYLHERMKKVVTFPAIPLIWNLEEHQVQALQSLDDVSTRDDVRDIIGRQISGLLPFLERVGEGDDEIWGLSALGELVVQTLGTGAIDMPPDREAPCVVEVSTEGHHRPPDFDALAKQPGDRLSFVTATVWYEMGRSGDEGLLMQQAHDADRFQVRLRLISRDGTRLYFRLRTTAKNESQWIIARRLAAEAFGRVSLAAELADDAAGSGRRVEPLPDAAQIEIDRLLMDRATAAQRARDDALQKVASLEIRCEKLDRQRRQAEARIDKAVRSAEKFAARKAEEKQKKIVKLENEIAKLRFKLGAEENSEG